jgi:hypothetical protein
MVYGEGLPASESWPMRTWSNLEAVANFCLLFSNYLQHPHTAVQVTAT